MVSQWDSCGWHGSSRRYLRPFLLRRCAESAEGYPAEDPAHRSLLRARGAAGGQSLLEDEWERETRSVGGDGVEHEKAGSSIACTLMLKRPLYFRRIRGVRKCINALHHKDPEDLAVCPRRLRRVASTLCRVERHRDAPKLRSQPGAANHKRIHLTRPKRTCDLAYLDHRRRMSFNWKKDASSLPLPSPYRTPQACPSLEVRLDFGRQLLSI